MNPPAETGDESKPGSFSSEAIKGLAGVASQVVFQAASIMEEEIAAGIVAAKQVEEHFVNVEEPQSDRSNVLMRRFRKDLHEVVDIVLDAITVATSYTGMVRQDSFSVATPDQLTKEQLHENGQVTTLLMPEPATADQRVELTMRVHDQGLEPGRRFSFVSTDLVSRSGERISARQVEFTPATLQLAGGHSEEVTISLKIPSAKPSGVYAGLIQATDPYPLQAVLIVRVS